MSRTVRWSTTASEQLEAIAVNIARVSPVYAHRLVDRLIARSEHLAQFPEIGRVSPRADDPDIRELIEGDYLMLYLVQSSRIDVLGVVHGRRELRWPTE